MFRTIKSRLIAITVFLVVAAISVATLVSFRLVRSFMLDDIALELGQTARFQSQRVAQWVAMQKDIVAALTPAVNMEDPTGSLKQALKSGKLDIVYQGRSDKRMVSFPPRDRAPDFDPTSRPWYKLAASQDKPIISTPYISAASKKLVVTFASAVRQYGELIAVTGSDVTLENVLSDLKQIRPTPSGYAFLMSRTGNIIAHPRTELTLKPISELSTDLQPEIIDLALAKDGLPEAVQIQGIYYFVKASSVEGTDWVLVTVAHQAEALQRLREVLTGAAISLFVVGIIAAVLTTYMVNYQLSGLSRIRNAMRDIGSGSGDLTKRISVNDNNELTDIAVAFNAFVKKIDDVMQGVKSSSESIAIASSEVASGSVDLSNRTEQTASNLEETAASMEQLNEAFRSSTESALRANRLAGNAAKIANQGGILVSQVISTMSEISISSKRIAEIIGTIDGIAFQTNILALNAAVEAARAGEQGRGFAVVASEVRSLAGRSAEAAREIKSLINASSERVYAGAKIVDEAGETMNQIVISIKEVSELVGAITSGVSTQRQGMDEIHSAISLLDRMTQQNAALVEQSTAAAASLREQAKDLSRAVAAFKISQKNSIEIQHRDNLSEMQFLR